MGGKQERMYGNMKDLCNDEFIQLTDVLSMLQAPCNLHCKRTTPSMMQVMSTAIR